MSELRSNEEPAEEAFGLLYSQQNYDVRVAAITLLAEVTRLRTDRDAMSRRVDEARDETAQAHQMATVYLKQRMDTEAERDAARAEVSQLRAKIEAERDQHQCGEIADMFGGYECDWCGESYATLVGCINKQRLTALLAEPLGSTEDPPAEGRSE